MEKISIALLIGVTVYTIGTITLVLKRIAIALEKANELKEKEMGIL